ncbi:MAG TPA: hypothetical protein VFW28_01285 [Micropepsaceae bacterium]|nr:hypothetical protein [Micropepsaceae bacterium]
MTDRHATFLVCDDVLIGLNGKIYIHGIYTQDLIIPTDEQALGQLVIFVLAETPIGKPFRVFKIQIQFPGESEPRIIDALPMALAMPPSANPDRTVIKVRTPVMIPQPTLRPGAIEISIIHEEGTLLVGKQWVQSMAAATASKH